MNKDALKCIQSDMGFDEVGVLRAFDLNRERISQSQPNCMGAVTKVLMTCCSATFECVDTTQTDVAWSAALRGRNGVLAGFSQGSGVIDPRQRSGHAGEGAPSFFRHTLA